MKTQEFLTVVSLAAWLAAEALAQKPPVAPTTPTPPVARAGAAVPPPAVSAPAEVLASAVAAVDKLGSDVTRGNYAVAIERMNPLWKERMANQTKGGMAEVLRQIEGASKRMTQEGVSIISSVHQGAPRSFEVGADSKVEVVKGEEVEIQIFTKWLVLVPTLTKYRLLLQGEPKPVVIEKTGFQVAVSDKGKNDWTFIDGSGLTVSALRRLYLTLPLDLELPPIQERKAADAH